MERRRFLRQVSLGTAAMAGVRPFTGAAGEGALPGTGRGSFRFGIISDVHQDIMHDATERVSAFVEAMRVARADFVIQLGDFCQPIDRNRPFLEAWNRFPGPRHHVLGNHDMDGGVSRETTVAFYGMPHRHYAFRAHGWQWIVLDGNDPGGSARGYRRFVADDQRAWLARELATGTEPVVVFIHQALDHPDGIENQEAVRRVLEAARWPDGSPRVVAVFSGHHHQDWFRRIQGIAYLQINSASYHWVGDAYAHESYPEAILEQHPWIRRTCPYREPLWALVTVDAERGVLEMEGRASDWVGPSPSELGIPETVCPSDTTVARIRSRRWELGRRPG